MAESRTPRSRSAKSAEATKTPKRSAKSAEATKTRRANAAAKSGKATARATRPTKATPAKKTTPAPTTRAKSGPTPARITLAGRVAKLRARGAKWSEIATETGVAEPTLAKLRKDVRAGVFANVSPVASRVRSDAF
jgi:hypothetical protein